MTPVWLVVRAGLRARWRSWLVLAVLTGLAGGLVTAVAAGARRAAIARLPQVTALAPVATYTVLEPAAATLGAPVNGAIPGTFWHRKLLAGRLPDARQSDEVDVSFTVTRASPYLQVGDNLPLLLLGAKGEPVRVNLRVVGIEAAPGSGHSVGLAGRQRGLPR